LITWTLLLLCGYLEVKFVYEGHWAKFKVSGSKAKLNTTALCGRLVF